MPVRSTKSIRSQLIIPIAVSMVLIVIGIQALIYLYQQNKQQAYAESLNIELNKSLQQAITGDTKKIEGFINLLKNADAIKAAWLNRNRTELLQHSTPIYHWLRAQHHITHFYFHEKDGSNFLRVHLPERFGDKINRGTLEKSMQTLDVAAGIELGTLGQFVLRTVSPWYENGVLTGFIEMGEEIDHIISHISDIHDYQIIFSVDKSNLINKELLKLTDNSNNRAIIFKTLNNTTAELLTFIDNEVPGEFKILKISNSTYLVSSILIRDIYGTDAGKLTYLHNFDDHYVYDENFLWGTLLINTSFGLALIIFYFFYSGKINTALKTSYNKLKTEIDERKLIEDELLNNKKELETLVEQRDRSLTESRQRYRTLFEKTADALLLIEDDKFIDCNQAMLDMFLYNSKQEIYNTHPSQISPEFQSDGQASALKANLMMQTALEKGSHRFEWNHARKNGEIFPAEVLLTAITAGDTKTLHAVVRDISSRKQAEDEIKYRAYYDSLTKLPNRQLLIDRLKQALITSRRRNNYNALLFLDLDRFKTINDSLGHSIGDLLLIETARRIKTCIREEDTASRFGGDEFVILIKNLGTEQEHASLLAKRIAEDILGTFSRPFKLKDHELHITSSIGINLFPLHDESLEDIIKNADTAMYSAKDSGRNKISFYLSEMHEIVLKKLTLEKDLRLAIRENKLKLHYQPQFDNDGEVTGVEALIRWQHPQHGFVNPEEFISIAEDTGMIYDIGAFVLDTSISEVLSLQDSYCMPKHISVNISPHQFMHPDFISQVRQAIEHYQLERNFLTLEITEGVVINNLSETVEKFQQLRKLGVRMSLDDFGTGYSSLSYLKRLPLDELKIDKSFVFDVMRDPHDALLVQTIIDIANQFGLDTVAEGVENEEQLNFLKQKSCKFYQGYHYSRPLPLHELTEFLLKN